MSRPNRRLNALVLRTPTIKRSRSQRTDAMKGGLALVLPNRSQRRFLNQVSSNRPESKSFDQSGSFPIPVFSNWSGLQCLNNMPVGTLANERVGRKIVITRVQVRGILLPSTSNGNYSQCRLVIVYDKANNGAAPVVVPTIMQYNTFNSPLALGYSDRFTVIADHICDSMQSSAVPISFNVFKKCNLPTAYISGGGALTDIGTGAIWAFIAGNQGSIVQAPGQADMIFRIRFTDV